MFARQAETFIMKSALNEWLHYLQTRREERSLMSFSVLLCHIWSKIKKYFFELISLLPLSSTPCFFWDQTWYRWSLPASLGSRADQACSRSSRITGMCWRVLNFLAELLFTMSLCGLLPALSTVCLQERRAAPASLQPWACQVSLHLFSSAAWCCATSKRISRL